MSKVLGPGLTQQSGPFKFSRSDQPKLNKVPWKGGGVAGGGTLHAGHGNWFSQMTPKVIRAVPYPLKPSQYASLVGPPHPSTYFTKQNIGRAFSTGNIVGRNAIQTGVQAPGQGNQPGRQLQGEPARQREEGEDDDDDFHDAMSITDSAQGDNSVSFHVPGEFPNQQTYVTTQPIVTPLLASTGTDPIQTTTESIVTQTDNVMSGRAMATQTSTTTSAETSTQAALDAPGEQIYSAEPVRPSNEVAALNHRITSLQDEIYSIRGEHDQNLGNYAVALHTGHRETENIRRNALARITELENQISEAEAMLNVATTSMQNHAATSVSLQQQAQDIANFFTGEVNQAERRGAFEEHSQRRRDAGSGARYTDAELRRRVTNSQLTARTAASERDRALATRGSNPVFNAADLRRAALSTRSPTQRARNRANASRPDRLNFYGTSI